MTDAELAARLRERAYLEGDFVLRSGRRSRYYLDKYRFETHPELLRELGKRIAARALALPEPPDLLAGPELGGVALAAAASLNANLPFLIVRKDAKEYGTAKRIEGVYEPGDRVCLIEDIVTTGGAAIAAIHALREAGLVCDAAICVVDREEGGGVAFAEASVRLDTLFRASEITGA